MEYPIEGSRDVDELGHVVLHQHEIVSAVEVTEILPAPGDKVVNADDRVPTVKKPIREMRSQESTGARDQDTQPGLPNAE